MYALAVVLAASSNSKTTSTNPVGTILFLVVIMVAAYVFFLRPRSQAARRQRETLMELGPGDEVLTGAGIFGTVLDVAADRVTIETAPGTRITVLRSTIARRITHTEDEPGGGYQRDYDEHDHAELGHDEHGYDEHEADHPDHGDDGSADTHPADGSAHDEPHHGGDDAEDHDWGEEEK